GRGQDHTRRAEAALQAVVLDERTLNRMQRAVGCQPLDRRDVATIRLPGEHGAALHGASVEEDGAGAALARVAADVGPRPPEAGTKRLHEECAILDVQQTRLAVDDERELRHRRAGRRACRAGTRGTAADRWSAIL